MKKCVFCGKDISDTAVFCRHCGKSLVNVDRQDAQTTVDVNEMEEIIGRGIKTLQNNVDSVIEEYKKTITKNEDLSKEIAALKEEKGFLEKELSRLKDKEREAGELKEELNKSKQMITDLDTQIADLKRSKETLDGEASQEDTVPDIGSAGVNTNDQESTNKEPEHITEAEPEPIGNDVAIRFCQHCGAEVLSDALFCLRCGKKIRE